MSKSLRSFVLVAALAVVVVPSLQAERAGCDPRPQVVATPFMSVATIVYTVMIGLKF